MLQYKVIKNNFVKIVLVKIRQLLCIRTLISFLPIIIVNMKLDISGRDIEIINNNEKFKQISEHCDRGCENSNVIVSFNNEMGSDEKKRKNNRFTYNQKLSLVMLASADFMSFCSMSIMSPFYSSVGAKKGMSETLSGFIFGYFALIMFLSSPVVGKIIPKVGAKYVFIYGLFISGVAGIAFGLLDRIQDFTTFVTLSFLVRGCQALGSSAYTTAGYVLIVNIFPEDAGAVRGLLETFVGLGLSAGPAIGGFLYSVGGFGLPFYVIGVATALTALLNFYLLDKPGKTDVKKSGSLIDLLKLPAVLITCLIMTVTSMTATYLDPILELHLRKFNLNPTQVGLMFLLLSATYGIFSPIVGWLTDRMKNYSELMTSGLLASSIVLLFLGPSPLLSSVQDSIWLNTCALLGLGIFIAASMMPTYQYILDNSMENGFEESLGTHSAIAGLWSSVYSLGEAIGPVLGGTLMEHLGFPLTSTTFALFNLVTGVAVLIYFRYKSVKSKQTHIKKEGVDNVVFYVAKVEQKTLPKIENDVNIRIRL